MPGLYESDQNSSKIKSKKRISSAPVKITKQEQSIAKKRFEQDIAKREADLLNELNYKFKANPVPISSLIPK